MRTRVHGCFNDVGTVLQDRRAGSPMRVLLMTPAGQCSCCALIAYKTNTDSVGVPRGSLPSQYRFYVDLPPR